MVDSIFFDNDRTLFAKFDYIGEDFDADMEKMRANPKVREWWAMTDSMQVRSFAVDADDFPLQIDPQD